VSTIEFQYDCRYNPDRNAIEFRASEGRREFVCEVAADALAIRIDANSADEAAGVAAFRPHRAEIHDIAKRLIIIGAITGTGRVLISKPMLERWPPV